MEEKQLIYLDYSATTPTDERVIEAMLPYWKESWGNPSSAHRFGQGAKLGLETARRTIANGRFALCLQRTPASMSCVCREAPVVSCIHAMRMHS